MKHSTTYNHKQQILSEMESLYYCASVSGMTSADMNQAYADIMAAHAGIPQYMKSFINGIRFEKDKNLYMYFFVYGGFYDGQFYSTESNRLDYYINNGIEPHQFSDMVSYGQIVTGHYWKTTTPPSPFFLYKTGI